MEAATEAVAAAKIEDAFPVSAEKGAGYQKSIELGKAVGYDVETDIGGYFKLFCDFDKDLGGSIDCDEMRAMIESLGMALSKKEMDAMIAEADSDKSNDIDFAEFYKVVSRDGPLAVLIARQKNAVKMNWREDEVMVKRSGYKVEGQTVSRAGEGWGCALLDRSIGDKMKVKGEDKKMNKGSILLEISATSGYVWVGLVGENFKPDGDWWNMEMTNMKNEKKPMCMGVCSKDGKVFLHGVDKTDAACGGLKLKTFGCKNATRLQIDVDTDQKEATFKVLDEAQGWEEVANCTVEGIKHIVNLAVWFSEASADSPTVVRLVGSSVELAQGRTRRASKDLWDDGNVMKTDTAVGGTGVGDAELNGP